MKTTNPLHLIFSLAAALLLSGSSSYADVVVSNLGEPGSASMTFSGNNWLAASFTTDSQSYTLNSVTAPLDSPIGNNVTVTLRIFADASGAPTGPALETFTPQTFSSGGNFTFNSTGLSLAPNTAYWAALSGSGFIPVWFATASTAQTGSWTIGDFGRQSTDAGATWPASSSNIGKFSVDATAAVPEPGHLAIVSLFVGSCATWRRRKTTSRD